MQKIILMFDVVNFWLGIYTILIIYNRIGIFIFILHNVFLYTFKCTNIKLKISGYKKNYGENIKHI